MTLRLGLCLIFLASQLGFTAAADPDELLPMFPLEANAMAVVNVSGILASPRAAKEGWSNLSHTEYLAGAVPVNPSVERMMLSKDFTPGTPNKHRATALIPLKNAVNLEKFAEAYRGQLVSVSDSQAVQIGDDTYAVAVKPNILGIRQVSNKQEISRWVRYSKDVSRSQQPGYINTAVRAHGKSHHIMLALDTEDLFDDQNAGLAVATSKVLAGEANAKPAKEIQSFFAKLRGFRVMIMVRDVGLTADLYLESKVAIKADPAMMKAFVIEFLDNYGAYLEDLPAATADLNQGVFHLGFKLTDPELAQLMALFITPLANVGESDTLTVTPAGVNAETSARYYRTVNKILDDLKAQTSKLKETDYKKTALWHETAATKIGTLSILNVDKEVAAYGQGCADRLKQIADSLKGVPIQSAALEGKAYAYRYNTTSMFFNGRTFQPVVNIGNVNSNYNEIQAAVDKVVADDEAKRKQLWNQMDSKRSEVRHNMAEKYKIDFSTPPKK